MVIEKELTKEDSIVSPVLEGVKGMEDKKLLVEVKIYEDGTVTINDKPLSEYVKEKIEAELEGSVETQEIPGGTEDINIFMCNNCSK